MTLEVGRPRPGVTLSLRATGAPRPEPSPSAPNSPACPAPPTSRPPGAGGGAWSPRGPEPRALGPLPRPRAPQTPCDPAASESSSAPASAGNLSERRPCERVPKDLTWGSHHPATCRPPRTAAAATSSRNSPRGREGGARPPGHRPDGRGGTSPGLPGQLGGWSGRSA